MTAGPEGAVEGVGGEREGEEEDEEKAALGFLLPRREDRPWTASGPCWKVRWTVPSDLALCQRRLRYRRDGPDFHLVHLPKLHRRLDDSRSERVSLSDDRHVFSVCVNAGQTSEYHVQFHSEIPMLS
jgi:hypothetical protein